MSEAPQYRLEKPFYVEDRIIPEDAVIVYHGMPNQTMVPLNDAARDKMREFIAQLKGGVKDKPLADQVYDALLHLPHANAEGVMVLNEKREVPLMGTVAIPNQARPASPRLQVEVVDLPKDPSQKPISVMGTVQSFPVNGGN